MQTKRNIFLWTLYDFANSIVYIAFFLYFSQWLVIDSGVPDIYFNLTFTVSAILLFLTVPITGSLLDKVWRRITGLRYSTVFTGVFFGVCALSAVFNKPLLSIIFFTLGLYSYLLTFIFYTPLLNDIVRKEKLGLVSGLGIAANYIGQITGLVIALPLSNGSISFFHSSPRAETLLPAVIIFLIVSLPVLIFFKEPHKSSVKSKGKLNLKSEIKSTWINTKAVFAFSGIGLFLISYFLFNDAILTMANNFPIFLEQVWQISDTTKTMLLLLILVGCAIGGLCAGFIADKFGHKKTLMFLLGSWIILLPILGLITNFTFFVIATALMGLWFGANWTVSRSVMTLISPAGKHNLSFAYYGLAERASSLLGPIVWGLIVSGFISLGSTRYRIAVIALTVFVVFGLIILSKVKVNEELKKQV